MENLTENTISYYDKNADEYVEFTRGVDFKKNEDIFLSFFGKGKIRILDFGCGSGRDTKYFLERGFLVDAIDGSKKLCEAASEYTGIEVKNMLFADLNEVDKYDGIWACASILHVPKNELFDVFKNMIRALKDEGIIYASFKYGDFEGERNGRYFTYFDEESFKIFCQKFSKEVKIEKLWISGDVVPGREGERWLNIILKKS